MVTDKTVGIATGMPPMIITSRLSIVGHLSSPSDRIERRVCENPLQLCSRLLTPIQSGTTLLTRTELNSQFYGHTNGDDGDAE